MKIYLTKANRKTTDYVLLEIEGVLLKTATGKVDRSGGFRSTLNAGSPALAIEVARTRAAEYRAKGFVESKPPSSRDVEDDGVFDKAKWHVTESFPTDIEHGQSYVHTGMFVAWLALHDLLGEAEDVPQAVLLLKQRRVAPVTLYRDYLDGVFTSEDVASEAIAFVDRYFRFDGGQYINDYLLALDPEGRLPSIFHVADTWENFDRLDPVVTGRFEVWKST